MAKAVRRRVKLSQGDVFELMLPDGRLGYGIIVKRGGLPNGGTPYVAIFRSSFESRPSLQTIISDTVALQGWTMDSLIYHGRWSVIWHGAAVPPIHFPGFKVEIDGRLYVVDVEGKVIALATASEVDVLDHQFSSTPMIFQDAFEAMHGFEDWKDYHDKLTPAYARARSGRADRYAKVFFWRNRPY